MLKYLKDFLTDPVNRVDVVLSVMVLIAAIATIVYLLVTPVPVGVPRV